jgi:hypothetical protein
MTTATATRPVTTSRNGASLQRNWITPLNLHWAAVGLLVLLNVYLLVHMVVLWHLAGTVDTAAFDQQKTELRIAGVAVQPLRGLDDKLSSATKGADAFYGERLPQSDSQVAAELGALTKKTGVRLTGANYTHAIVLPSSPGQLTELDIDARLSGDYRPLMQFVNSLERDKMFFLIRAVTFNGQQSGTVNLRLHITTYQRGAPPATADAGPVNTSAPAAPAGGPR